MDPPLREGLDASSLKPVSSLRAKFENLNKPGDSLTPPPRTASPAPVPKPERLRETKPLMQKEHLPPPMSHSSVGSGLQIPGQTAAAHPKSPARFSVGPPSPLPSKPPSVLVQPPLSPPKGKINATVGEQPSFLNPDLVATPTSARSFKISARSHSPSAEARNYPKPTGSGPPSPPPPRRSSEIRQLQEAKPIPPPVNRSEKPNFGSRSSFIPDAAQVAALREHIPKSPFNSPPDSSSSSDSDSEEPPPMPTRPRPKTELIVRPPNFHASSFEPSSLYPSTATRKTEQDTSIPDRRLSQQLNGEHKPRLPTRAFTNLEPPPPAKRSSPHSEVVPPPRPPRPAPQQARAPSVIVPVDLATNSSPPKRVVSTPTSQQEQTQLTVRPHGRSMTVNHTSDRAPQSLRAAPPARALTIPREEAKVEPVQMSTSLPDISKINRREPYIKSGTHEIVTGVETRAIDVSTHFVCTTTMQCTRAWSLVDGEQVMFIDHSAIPLGRGTAVKFKPGSNLQEEGTRIWVGDSQGILAEFDVITGQVMQLNATAHARDMGSVGRKQGRHQESEIVKMHRHYNELWTLDSNGTLQVWGPDTSGVPNLANAPHVRRWLGEGHTFSMIVDDELWFCAGKTIGVCLPTWETDKPLKWEVQNILQDSAGEICAGATLKSHSKKVFLGHTDGRVSIYSRKDYSCLSVLNVSPYKINSLAGVGDHLWAAFSSGRICAYDIDPNPWVVRKDWVAHGDPVVKLISDPSSFYTFDQARVISLAGDGTIKCWDGLLQEDWLEEQMKINEAKYCQLDNMRALVMTWNAGASTPFSLNQEPADARFFSDLLTNSDAPEIVVFGFQELVDLEDKSAAAKRWMKLGKKSKNPETAQERMKHQYRDWRDHLQKCLDHYLPESIYHQLHCATMVGLFTCVFVRSSIREKVTNLSTAQVKRGMGGLDGNKGAIIIRFMINNSSLCFVNCHLAAGQSQANDRHKDVAKIMDAVVLAREPNPDARIDSYVGGGDGTMIMDHELCILNGDLNYRIDTMSRDTVVIAVKQNNLQKLLERDQLLVTRRRNNAFKLRAFEELPIAFAPTYKYDVGTDNYDTSDKKRSPAWCDRLLYRSREGKIRQLDYRRHEVKVSDHRPVTGRFVLNVKTVAPRERAAVWIDAQRRFEDIKMREAKEEKIFYLTRVVGYDENAANRIIGEQETRSVNRSSSRNRACVRKA